MGRKNSKILDAVHETACDLHKLGFISKRTMEQYDALCMPPASDYTPEQIKSLRDRYQLSQSVLAAILNTSISTVQKWEIGEKHPGGPSLKLLNILDRKGLTAMT